MIQIIIIPVLKDNYSYLIHNKASGFTAVVDPGEAAPVLRCLSEQGWKLTHILTTHHHPDHTGGNRAIQAATDCHVVGYEGDAHRIPAIDTRVKAGECFSLGGVAINVLFIPGHTLGHIAYFLPDEKIVFCGDTLFSLGCGRLFEGTARQLYTSLQILAQLPEDTRIYCGHEYTEANGRFTLTLEPHNTALLTRMQEVASLRAQGLPTVPSTMAKERATNPFLRTESAEIQQRLGCVGEDAVAIFTAMREQKDRF